MKTFMVADGGGTKTEYLLFTQDGHVLAHAKTSGTNATFINAQQAAQHVKHGVELCLKAAQIKPQDISYALLFIPGFAPAMKYLNTLECDFYLMDDFWNAYYGALAAPTGIVALAGTGSFVAGRTDITAQLVTAGGWGPLFGDTGSGYRLGVMCLQAVARQYDKGESNSILSRLLMQHMNIESIDRLRLAAYSPEFTREIIADLSHLTQQAAEMGDSLAPSLFDNLAQELSLEVKLLSQRLNAPENLKLSVTGGMCNAGKWFIQAFEKACRQNVPHLKFSPAKYSPLLGGALYLIAEKEKLALTDTLAESMNIRLNILKGE